MKREDVKNKIWLTPKEAAEIIAASEITIRRQAYAGLLPSRKFGRCLRIPASAVMPEPATAR